MKDTFTKREKTILFLLGREGLTNEEMADRLFSSRRTVETHRRNISIKTGLSGARLVLFAHEYAEAQCQSV